MSWAVDSGFAAFLSQERLESKLHKLNTVHPGMLDPTWAFDGFKWLRLKQFRDTNVYVRVDRANSELIEGEVWGLNRLTCKRRDGLGVLAKERLPPPALYGLSLSCLPVPPGEVRLTHQAWLHLSGEPVVFGVFHWRTGKFSFGVPLEELEAIVDALANAPKEDEVVFGS